MPMKAGAALLLLLLGACGGTIPRLAAPYNAAMLQPYLGKGTATVTGQAFLKTRGGDVKPCAGDVVMLIPATAHTDEWFQANVVEAVRTVPMDSGAEKAVRHQLGDAQGNFTFADLPAGTYHVVCEITWQIPGDWGLKTTGGYAYATTTVADGEAVRVIATR